MLQGPPESAAPARIATLAVQPPVIQLEAVRKAFAAPDGQRFEAVRETTLAIERGDIFGLVGKSGAGKSTLLRLINLLERPDAGRVIVAGRDLTALTRAELRDARQGVGMIFQQFNLLQNATVFENVAFPLRIHGRHGARAIAARVDDCLALVGLAEKSASHPAQLSGGPSQPDVLLCDEPTSALDAETTESLLATLRDINATLGVTIVIVTHELPVVTTLCRHVAVVEDGAIAERFPLAAGARAPAHAVTRLGRDLLRLNAAADVDGGFAPRERAHA